MDDILSVLDGYKTYLVSFVAMALAVAKMMLGWDFPGVIIDDPVTTMQVALTAIFLRRGIKTS